MDYDLDTPSTSDEISCGSLALNGQQFSDFNFVPTANFVPGVYDLIAFGSYSGSLGASTTGTLDGYPATLEIQGNDLVLMVPEPSTLALLLAGAVALGIWWMEHGSPARWCVTRTGLEQCDALPRFNSVRNQPFSQRFAPRTLRTTALRRLSRAAALRTPNRHAPPDFAWMGSWLACFRC